MNIQLMKKAQKLFADSIKLKVEGGTGGTGLPKFGGIGGKGGNVYVVGSDMVKRLDSVYNTKAAGSKFGWFKAHDGKPALRTRLLGEQGQDLVLKVPSGVTVQDIDGQHLGEINKPQDKVIVALGGRGGDKFTDSQGHQGQKRILRLDLKLISDAVFVGFPNAGKSSLLRAISNAQPRVASYPFTTLRPYLGLLEYDDYRRITVTDLPGLVEGAHKNLGLGHSFLKHIVRSRLLIFVIDVNHVDIGPSYPQRSPLETLCILNKEMELFDDTLLRKPSILVVNKVDSFTESDFMVRYKKFREEFYKLSGSPEKLLKVEESIRPSRLVNFDEMLPVSAENNKGLQKLKFTVRHVIDKYEEQAKFAKDRYTTYQELIPFENNRIKV